MTLAGARHAVAWCSLCVALSWGLSAQRARPADYLISDAADAATLERSLFVCQWRIGHGVPQGAPVPLVCTNAAISTDDAVHETRQWWMYWARLDTDQAAMAKIRFNQDFEAFQTRLAKQPELAGQLLPPGNALPPDDWRRLLVRQLQAAAAHP